MSKRSLIIVLLVFTTLLVYISLRAYYLSFTHDESLSFTIIQGVDTWRNTANNHALNTVLMSISSSLFGTSEFALRLPNVLSFALYALGCFLLFKTSKKNWLFLLGISITLLNPFLLEFFSLSRGYGLSLAFMTLSMFFLFKDENQYWSASTFTQDFLYASFFASLAVYANLSMINFFFALLLIQSLKFWMYRGKHNFKPHLVLRFFAVFLISCVPVTVGIMRLLELKQAGQLYFGASTFLEGLGALIISSIFIKGYAPWAIDAIALSAVFLVAMGVVLIILRKKYRGPLFLSTILLVTLIIGLFIEHYLFDAKFPAGRTALLYIPIYALFIYHLVEFLIREYHIKKQYLTSASFLVIIPMMINFGHGMNLTTTKTWMYDAHTKDVMKTIKKHTENIPGNLVMSSHWLFKPSINYYISIWNLKLDLTTRKGIDLNADLIYQLDAEPTYDGFRALTSYDDIHGALFINNRNKQ